MSTKDGITKDFMRNPEYFADAFNKLLYHGSQVIKPDELYELDTTELVVPFMKNYSGSPVQRYRDILKIYMSDKNRIYCILGIENQSNIHYAMPVKNGLYDFLQLSEQVSEIARNHKKNKEYRKENDSDKQVNSDEFLSGFYKDDRLLPVITLVIYWGSAEWDAPLTLKEMYAPTDRHLLEYVADYKINLIAPGGLSDAELTEFHTDLRQIMTYIKYSDNKDKLLEVTSEDEKFSHLSRQATDVLNTVTGSKLHYRDDEEEINVCKAIRDLVEDGRQEGIQEGYDRGKLEGYDRGKLEGYDRGKLEGYDRGKLEGYDRGKLEGYDRGKLEGYDQGRLANLKSLVLKHRITIAEAAEEYGITEEKFSELLV